jgi:hypothetical protein
VTAHDTALKFALLKVLTTQLADAKKAADCEIRDTWKLKDRNAAVLPDGTEIGSVTLAKGRASARVADEDAYMAWVLENHPERIEQIQVTRVEPGYTERILAHARTAGVAVDVETGAVVEGVTVAEGDAYPTTKLTVEATALVASAWRDGSLSDLIAALVQPAVEQGEAVAGDGAATQDAA